MGNLGVGYITIPLKILEYEGGESLLLALKMDPSSSIGDYYAASEDKLKD